MVTSLFISRSLHRRMSFLKKFSVITAVSAALLAALIAYLQSLPAENQAWNIRMAESAPDNRATLKEANEGCFIVGYTGEVGKVLVQEILKNQVFKRVVLIGRRKVEFDDDVMKSVEQHVVDFDKLDEYKETFQGIDQGFCCLGTTRGKAGAKGFVKVDYDYVMNTARLAKEGGVKHFHLVSSGGANKNSSLLYTQTKGRVEADVSDLGFDRVSIYRPAVLMCDRTEKRSGEGVLRTLLKPIAYFAPTLASIPTTTVAKAMVNIAASPKEKDVIILENKALHQIAGAAQ
ncbi:unnamed protein product [Owenia fusiformis]|uniref:Protein HTATIP2 n=1 Tax=Owenia fusiformis TaxID=6347 RepID=A0A8J1Y305_OWEFU|nr:unnamed protein product [Owenia fusiformis]